MKGRKGSHKPKEKMEGGLKQLTQEETVDFIMGATVWELMRELGERRQYRMDLAARTANGTPLLVAVLRAPCRTRRLWGGRLMDEAAARRLDGGAVVRETVANVLWTLWGLGDDRGAAAKRRVRQAAKRKARRAAKKKTRRGRATRKSRRKDASRARRRGNRGPRLRRVEWPYEDMDRGDEKWLMRAYAILYGTVRYEGVEEGLGITREEYLERLRPLKPKEGERSYKADVYKELTRPLYRPARPRSTTS